MFLELSGGRRDGLVHLGRQFVGARRQNPIAIPLEHRQRTIDQVAQAIGPLAMTPRLKAGIGPVAVGPDVQSAHDIIAESMDAPFLDDRQRVNDVPGAFGYYVVRELDIGPDGNWTDAG